MKYLIYAALLFIFGLLFFPESGTTQIRNLPLLIAVICIIVAFVAFKILKQAVIFFKVKKQLLSNKYKIIKTVGFGNIIAQTGIYDKKVFNIVILNRKNKYARYHFDSSNNVSFYKSVVITSKNGKGVSRFSETRLTGKRKIKWSDESGISEKILVIDKMPNRVTDSLTNNRELGNGDKVCSDFYIYDYEGFVKYISK